jgi:DNA-binding Xre family transcriptional regulator
MAESRDQLQDLITTNVKVLMAVRGIRQTELADQLGWDRTVMSNRVTGKRRWMIENLGELAEFFGIAPGVLLGSAAEVAGAVGPAAVGGRPSRRGDSPTGPYVGRSLPYVGESAHVIDLNDRLASRARAESGVTQAGAPRQAMVRDVG